jgi:hypothetical protein
VRGDEVLRLAPRAGQGHSPFFLFLLHAANYSSFALRRCRVYLCPVRRVNLEGP